MGGRGPSGRAVAQYQHTWYADATFNMPTPASPGFNYAFGRDDNTVKLGFTISFSPPPPAATPSYPVKMPPAK